MFPPFWLAKCDTRWKCIFSPHFFHRAIAITSHHSQRFHIQTCINKRPSHHLLIKHFSSVVRCHHPLSQSQFPSLTTYANERGHMQMSSHPATESGSTQTWWRQALMHYACSRHPDYWSPVKLSARRHCKSPAARFISAKMHAALTLHYLCILKSMIANRS